MKRCEAAGSLWASLRPNNRQQLYISPPARTYIELTTSRKLDAGSCPWDATWRLSIAASADGQNQRRKLIWIESVTGTLRTHNPSWTRRFGAMRNASAAT